MSRRRVPNDPERRDRIVVAALELMGRDGLHTLTHRRVAAAAGVPLGSTTYYFRDLDELMLAAVRLSVEHSRARIAAWEAALPRDAGVAEVCAALAAMTVTHVTEHAARTVLDYELYVAGLRREVLRAQSAGWIGLLRAALGRRVDEGTADALTAATDGLTLQALLAGRAPSVGEVTALLRRVAEGPAR